MAISMGGGVIVISIINDTEMIKIGRVMFVNSLTTQFQIVFHINCTNEICQFVLQPLNHKKNMTNRQFEKI